MQDDKLCLSHCHGRAHGAITEFTLFPLLYTASIENWPEDPISWYKEGGSRSGLGANRLSVSTGFLSKQQAFLKDRLRSIAVGKQVFYTSGHENKI